MQRAARQSRSKGWDDRDDKQVRVNGFVWMEAFCSRFSFPHFPHFSNFGISVFQYYSRSPLISVPYECRIRRKGARRK